MNKSVIVFGPQGCGKTVNAQRIADYLGLSKIIDDDLRSTIPEYDALLLSSVTDRPFSAALRAIAFDDVMQEMATAVTQWFPADVKPVHVGFYQRAYGGMHEDNDSEPDLFDGNNWIVHHNGVAGPVARSPKPWRGLSENPAPMLMPGTDLTSHVHTATPEAETTDAQEPGSITVIETWHDSGPSWPLIIAFVMSVIAIAVAIAGLAS